jgi:hypothetical protein
MSDDKFNNFNLVGGTALALKIGHRVSVDIDLFSTTPFNTRDLGHHLAAVYSATDVRRLGNSIFCFVDDIKVDLLPHEYPLVGNIDIHEGIRMVSLLDIGAMKLNAIFNSGQRLKDFVDMYSLLETFTLHELLDACQRKYPDLNINMVKHSLIHFNDIIFSPIEFIGPEVKWPIIVERLQKAFHNPYFSFGLPESIKKMIQCKPSDAKGRRKGPKP